MTRVVFIGFLALTSASLVIAGNAANAVAEQPATTIQILSLGLISANPLGKIEAHQDFVNYVARKLSPTGGVTGRVVVAPTPSHLSRLMNERKVDFYMESAYPTVLVNQQTGARLLLRRWKGARGEYRGLIFTMKASGITSLRDLVGKLIVFEDPGSTSAYFLPKVLLLKHGFKLTQKFSFDSRVAPNEIGYVFAFESEENIVNWVLLKKVAAGAFSTNDLDDLDEARRAQLLILAETENFPRALVSVRKDLPPAVVSHLKEILLSMHLDEEGQRALRKADKTTKFDLLPGGEESLYRKIREMLLVLHGK